MAFSFRRQQKRPDNMLPPGWQFYSRPTNLEGPGTVFRIDKDGTRFIVGRLAPVTDSGPEPGMSKVESIEMKIGIMARLLGLEAWNADVSGSKVKTLEFELTRPVRESTTDQNMDAVLKPFVAGMEFRPKNRYFVVREVRSAEAMKYRLSNDQLGELGGKAAVSAVLTVGTTLSAKSADVYDLAQTFPERLGVMFLPEEIVPATSALGGRETETELGRVPVERTLDWVESSEPVGA
jgi:hypothetical protein